MVIEGSSASNNQSGELDEYYDGVRNIAVTRIRTLNNSFTIYSYDNTNEAFIINGNLQNMTKFIVFLISLYLNFKY